MKEKALPFLFKAMSPVCKSDWCIVTNHKYSSNEYIRKWINKYCTRFVVTFFCCTYPIPQINFIKSSSFISTQSLQLLKQSSHLLSERCLGKCSVPWTLREPHSWRIFLVLSNADADGDDGTNIQTCHALSHPIHTTKRMWALPSTHQRSEGPTPQKYNSVPYVTEWESVRGRSFCSQSPDCFQRISPLCYVASLST